MDFTPDLHIEDLKSALTRHKSQFLVIHSVTWFEVYDLFIILFDCPCRPALSKTVNIWKR